MKLKAIVLVVLVVAVIALIYAKGIKTESTPEDYSSNIPVSQTASLIEKAKQNGQPAWLLFHSTK